MDGLVPLHLYVDKVGLRCYAVSDILSCYVLYMFMIIEVITFSLLLLCIVTDTAYSNEEEVSNSVLTHLFYPIV